MHGGGLCDWGSGLLHGRLGGASVHKQLLSLEVSGSYILLILSNALTVV